MARKKLANQAQRAAAKRSVVPIPATIESIKGYPQKLVIFQVPASPYWWVRYYDGKPIKRSTKTSVKRDAVTFAKEFYEQFLVNKRLGVSNNPRQTSFALCAEQVLEEDARRATNGELSASYVANHKSIIRGHISDFLGGYELADIDYAVLDKFKTYLFDKKLAASSVKLHFVFVKKILEHAVRTKVLRSSPLLPKIKGEDNPRGYFTLPEYKALRRTARELVGSKSELRQVIRDDAGADTGKTKKLRNIIVTDEIALLIPFMIYAFIRPTDVKNIQHRHIEIRQGDHGKDYLFMPIPTSKKHDKPITSMPRAATFYKRLKAMRSAQLPTGTSIDDEYVFMPSQLNRTYAYRQLVRQFDVLLENAKLRVSADGDVRTLYSLRHTSLMYRLKYGGQINPLILANNARTSVEMLERFYLAQLESSQFTADLHARKPIARKKSTQPQPKKDRMLVLTVPELPTDHNLPGPQSTSIRSTDASQPLDFKGIAAGKVPDKV